MNYPTYRGPQPPMLPTTIMPTPAPMNRSTKSVMKKAASDALDLRADAAMTAMAIDMLADLDELRLNRARSAEVNQLMFQLEAGFAAHATKRISNRNSPFGGF